MSTSRVIGLRCRACGNSVPAAPVHVCELCFGPLDVEYNGDAVRAEVSRRQIEAGPPSIWRYEKLLPVDLDGEEPVTLGEGFTPLLHARNLGRALGLRNVYVKNDTMNPTNSFKDRVVSVAATWSRRQGFTTLACASTGNLANSVAAYAARAGLRAFVFVPANLEAAKVETTAVFRPTLVRVHGNYDEVNRLCSELADNLDWAFCNINVRPFYSEGSKTLTFETAEQLGWRLPDEIVIPVASGCQFVKHHRAVAELIGAGLVNEPPRTPALTGAQAAGCAPVADAFAQGRAVSPVRPDTIAKSIAIGNPSDGNDVIRLARETNGTVASVTDTEILEGIELLAETEGIFAETAAGTVVAVLRKLARAGRWSGDETIVAYITGHGLKTAEAMTGRIQLSEPIQPSIRSFEAHYGAIEAAGTTEVRPTVPA